MDIASLGIKMDTSDVARAAVDLDKVVEAGGRAEETAKRTGKAWEQALGSMAGDTQQIVKELQALNAKQDTTAQLMATVGKSLADVSQGFSKASVAANDLAASETKLAESADAAKARILAMAKASLGSSEYYQTLTASVKTNASALDASGSSVSSLAALQRRLQSESDALVGSTGRQAEAAKKAAAATGVQAEGLQALLGKISPAQKKLQELDDLQNQLAQHKKAGFIDADGFAQYSAAIDLTRSKVKGFDDGVKGTKGGLSALALNTKEARENVLQLGNALAEGNIRIAAHNILQIGMNAGASAASMALAAAPALALAAAVGVLAYGYVQGSKEADTYNKSLILTGNYAGVSAGQLGDMARQVSATVGTTGAAAEALAQLAGSGKIAGGSFEEVATAALKMQEATGKAAAETIAEFVKIGKDPVAAAKELNDQYHFLTASVYSQIVALKEQGDEIGATKLLTDTYAETVKVRAAEMTQNLGYVERAWKGIKDGAAGALDGLNNIGRDKGLGTQLKEAQDQLALMTANGRNAEVEDPFRYKDVTGRISFLELQIDAEKSLTGYLGERTRIQKEGIDAEQRLKQISDSNLTNAEKRDKLTKAYLRDVEALKKANPDDPKVQADYVAKTLQNIKDKNKDPKAASAGAVDLTGFNNSKAALTSTLGDYKNAQKELDAAQKAGLISQSDYLLKRQAMIGNERDEVTAGYETEIAALEAVKGKAGTSAAQRIQLDQKIADARASMVKAQKDADVELEVLATNEKGRLKKQELAVQTYTDALNQQVATLRQQGMRAAAGLGMGDRQRGMNDQFNSVDDKANQQRIDLANQYGDGSRGMSLDEYNAKLKAVTESQQALHSTVQSNYDDMTKAQGDWSAGASSAWQNYLESTRDVAGQTKSLFTTAFSSMEDAVVNFAMTGKLSFGDFAKSILADMARIAARQASSSALSSLFGLAASAAGAYFGGGGNGMASGSAGAASSNLGASQAGYSSTYFPQAKGGAWDSGVQMFANGGAFTDSIVSKPTAFSMANGKMGVAGEAGPEAIVPLARDSQGRLGVRGGSSNSSQVVITVNVDASEGGGATPDPARLADAIKAVVKQEIATARRNGGMLT